MLQRQAIITIVFRRYILLIEKSSDPKYRLQIIYAILTMDLRAFLC